MTTRPTISSLRVALRALEGEFAALKQLHDQDLERLKSAQETRDFYAQRLKEADAAHGVELAEARRRAQAPFTRADVERMTRVQLVSLIEEAINEARRKGLVEAEGLLSRHRELTDETNLEVMRGVVKTYQERIAVIEKERADKARAEAQRVQLDTKLTNPAQAVYQAPPWWKAEPTPPPANKPSSFVAFDRQAERIADAAAGPRTLIQGQRQVVKGTSGGSYVLGREGSVFSCTCPSWLYSKDPTDERTCKHLKRYLGVGAEARRIDGIRRAKRNAPQPSCWCGTLLVRGQCQLHTRDWKGPEKCTCGRQFASCKAAYDTLSEPQRRVGHQPRLAA